MVVNLDIEPVEKPTTVKWNRPHPSHLSRFRAASNAGAEGKFPSAPDTEASTPGCPQREVLSAKDLRFFRRADAEACCNPPRVLAKGRHWPPTKRGAARWMRV